MNLSEKSREELLREIEELKRRLAEPEETVSAIRNGKVDAFVVSSDGADRVFTIARADPPYRRMIEEMNDGAMILALDGTILYANRCLAEHFGVAPAKLRGGAVFSFVTPQSRRGFERILANETAESELTLRSEDGAEFPVQIAVNRLNLDDVPVLCVVVADLTERKKIEAERARVAACMDHAGEMIVITDADANIQYVNPAFEKITGYQRSEALGKNPRILKSGTQGPAFYESMWDALRRDGIWSGTFTNRKKDGTLYVEAATISSVTDAAGKTTNYVAVKRDITEQVALEKRLQSAEKMEAVGRLAAGIAHDFNNLITVIEGTASLVQRRPPADDPVQADLRVIRAAGRQAAELTRSLLVFSRGQAIEPEVLDLRQVVEETRDLARGALPDNIILEVQAEAGAATVSADKGHLQQVILNLCLNSRDAMPAGGRITLRISSVKLDAARLAGRAGVAPGVFVVLSVTDTGIGMDAETMARIWEPFFSTKATGAGLGLATVFGIVRQHGGFTEVESEPGRGATIRVYLPSVARAARPDTLEPAPRIVGGGETVLVVEDQPALRRMVAKALTTLGYRVLEAKDGAEALDIVRKMGAGIDLVLTDAIMPRMGGKELFELSREQRPDLAFLFTSGVLDPALRDGTLAQGGVGWIEKPFDLDVLAAKVRTVLDRSRA